MPSRGKEFVLTNQTVNFAYYCDVLRQLRENVRRFRPELEDKRTVYCRGSQTFSVSGALISLVFCHGALGEICVHPRSTKCCTLYNVQGLCFTTRLLHNIVIVAKHKRCTFVQHFIEHDCDCILTLVTRHRNENNHNLRLT
jgi:hypothetical protein